MIPGSGNSDLLQKGEATTPIYLGLFVVQPVKNVLACGDLSTTPGFGRSPGEGKGYPLQYSGLEDSMDCIVHGVAKLKENATKKKNTKKQLYGVINNNAFLTIYFW